MFSSGKIVWMLPMIYGALSLAYAEEIPPSRGFDAAQSTPGIQSKLVFSNQEFSVHEMGRIDNGWAAYYTINHVNPESATDEIIVDHLNPRNQQGQAISAIQVARAMLDNVKSRRGVIIKPFAVPDKSASGSEHLTYYATFYYIYPQRGLGDVWLSRIFTSDAGPTGILYRHAIAGDNARAIEEAIRHWVAENLNSYGAALATLSVQQEPSAVATPRP